MKKTMLIISALAMAISFTSILFGADQVRERTEDKTAVKAMDQDRTRTREMKQDGEDLKSEAKHQYRVMQRTATRDGQKALRGR